VKSQSCPERSGYIQMTAAAALKSPKGAGNESIDLSFEAVSGGPSSQINFEMCKQAFASRTPEAQNGANV